MVFQIMPRMNYDAFKEYSKYKTQMEKNAAQGSGRGGTSLNDKLRMD